MRLLFFFFLLFTIAACDDGAGENNINNTNNTSNNTSNNTLNNTSNNTSSTNNSTGAPKGECWAEVTGAASFSPRAGHTSVFFKDRIWVIGGFENREQVATALNDVWASPDGAAWSLVTDAAPFSPRASHCTVVFQDRLWVMGGNNDTDYYSDVWSSTDGVTWSLERSPEEDGFSDRKGFTCAVHDDRIWIFGGVDYGGISEIWSSPDGRQWTSHGEAPWPGRGHHAVAWLNGSLYLFGGHVYTSDYFDDIWSSQDALTWTREDPTLPSPLYGHSALSTGESLLITGGNGQPDGTWAFDGVAGAEHHETFPPRAYHTSLWAFGRGFVIGGSYSQDLGLALRNDVWATCQ